MEKFSFFLQILLFLRIVTSEVTFIYNGFHHANLSLNEAARLRSDGVLALTSDKQNLFGHAFYPFPLQFRDTNTNESSVVSFSTNFVFSIKSRYQGLGGHGLAFVLMSTKEPNGCLASQFLGLPNNTGAPNTARFLAVEFDVVKDFELLDINDNHVGIDLSSLISNISQPAVYSLDKSTKHNKSINLKSGDLFEVWIDYTSQEKLINVTLAPLGLLKPNQPLLSFPLDLSTVLDEYMYAGFTASTGVISASHNVFGWSFKIGGMAPTLDPHRLARLGRPKKMVKSKGFILGIILASVTLFFLIAAGVRVISMLRNYKEIIEDWELEYGARRFKYLELVATTKGFDEGSLIGFGGFGRVYKGTLPSKGIEVAIKRVAPDSPQGMKEFVAEITSMGRLRHRNLVQLHGWCRKQDDLFLVYEYVPNGSLDDLLYGYKNSTDKIELLTWDQRYKILVGIAQALLYLHEECEHFIVHRDVKPSNVLIDENLNPKLGDFGLARAYGHGTRPQTTQIVGTLGYLAPEFSRTGKATRNTDVYSYGALVLEVASGRRPIDPQKSAEEVVLVDWVSQLNSSGEIIRAIDPVLEEYDENEANLVLQIGLLCSHPDPNHRPTMRRVLQVLLGSASLPLPPASIHLEDAIVVTNHSNIYSGQSYPSYGTTPSTMSTSFSSCDKKSRVNT